MSKLARKGIQTTIKPTIQVSRPLGDKTPFPNRQQNIAPLHTPAPKAAKVAKLSLLEQDLQELAKTPGHLLLPSSTRKSLRAPRHSGAVKCYDFKTPMTNGNHWDVSDGEIQLDMNTAETELEDEEDYDEIEYMPPKMQGGSSSQKSLGIALIQDGCRASIRASISYTRLQSSWP